MEIIITKRTIDPVSGFNSEFEGLVHLFSEFPDKFVIYRRKNHISGSRLADLAFIGHSIDLITVPNQIRIIRDHKVDQLVQNLVFLDNNRDYGIVALFEDSLDFVSITT